MHLQASILASAEGDPIVSVIRVPSDCPHEAPLRAIRYSLGQSESDRRLAIAEFAAQPFVRRNRRVLEMIGRNYHGQLLRFVEPASALEDAQGFLGEVANFHTRLNRSEYLSQQGAMDGLGDRNRSVSPEGYDVWETLLTTVTPDPQPPSIGSSFTSASASMVASQSAVTASSATSFTNPETAEERVGHEPGCESDGETDSDNDDTVGGLLPITSQQLEVLVRNRGPEAERLEASAAQLRAAARRIPRTERSRILEAMGDATRSVQAGFRRHDDAVQRHNEAVRQHSVSAQNLANIRRRLAAVRARDRRLVLGPHAEDGGQAHAGETGETGSNPTDSPDTGAQQNPVPASEPAVPPSHFLTHTLGGGGTGGMQNIIRALAQRQDIPNSWWAEAGLSRNIPDYDTSE
ncbi:hypothetical protein DL546_002709 [Coniochaeta pulveracea]|nr:hypothetical protein DL546_002709 [Coniochaeta pulveracea]